MSGGYRGDDAARAITDALIRDGARAAVGVTVVDTTSIPWESATFSGARHRLTIELTGGGAIDAWLADLPERPFDLRGHIVADIVVPKRCEGVAIIEALTVASA